MRKKKAKEFVPRHPGERVMSEAQVLAAARSDPDAQPMTKAKLPACVGCPK